jgi:hypothetical protein
VTRSSPSVAPLVGVLAALLVALGAAPALATQPAGEQTRISQVGADGDVARVAENPAAAFDPVTGRALVVWTADAQVNDKAEVFGRFVGGDGAPLGGAFRIGTSGKAGDATFDDHDVFNPKRRQFFVVWTSEEPPLENDFEIRGQRVSATGELVGGSARLSAMGVGDVKFNAAASQVAYNSVRDEYLVVWHGIDDALPGRNEVYGHRVSGTGAPQGADVRISTVRNSATWPTVAYNSQANEYMVAMIGNDSKTNPKSQRAFVQRLTADVVRVGANKQVFQAGECYKPAIVYNSSRNEYLLAVPGIVGGDTEAYVQRIDASGAQIGTNDARISQMGPDGAPEYGIGQDVAVGYSPRSGEYLVTWHGDTTAGGLVNDEIEVFGQGLDSNGAQVPLDDFPISSMGPDGTPKFGAGNFQFTGPLAYLPSTDRFLAVWVGDDGPPLADNEIEVYGQTIAPTPAAVAPPPPPPPPSRAKVMPNFTPLFATRARGSKGVRGSLYGISGLGSLPYGTVVSLRCESHCKMKQRSFTVRPRGKLKRTSLNLRKPVGLTSLTRMRVTARHTGYISRYIRVRFVRKNLGVIARRVGSGCQTRDKKPRKASCS